MLACIVLFLIGIAAFAPFNRPKTFLQAGESLVDPESKQKVGIARKSQDGNLWRVFATVSLPEVDRRHAYHGWLTEPLGGQIRYVGEFFPSVDGFSLTYTTEEDIRFYKTFEVSRESLGIPDKPSNSVAKWDFEVNNSHAIPSLSPAPSPETSPAFIPEISPTPETSATAAPEN